MFCLLLLSSSIPFEVLQEDDWHSIVSNQCKNSAEKAEKKPWRSSTIAVSGVLRLRPTTLQAHIHNAVG